MCVFIPAVHLFTLNLFEVYLWFYLDKHNF